MKPESTFASQMIFLARLVLFLPLSLLIGYALNAVFVGGENLACTVVTGGFGCFNQYFDLIMRLVLFCTGFVVGVYKICPTRPHLFTLVCGVVLGSFLLGLAAFYGLRSPTLTNPYTVSFFIGGIYTLIIAYDSWHFRFREMW